MGHPLQMPMMARSALQNIASREVIVDSPSIVSRPQIDFFTRVKQSIAAKILRPLGLSACLYFTGGAAACGGRTPLSEPAPSLSEPPITRAIEKFGPFECFGAPTLIESATDSLVEALCLGEGALRFINDAGGSRLTNASSLLQVDTKSSSEVNKQSFQLPESIQVGPSLEYWSFGKIEKISQSLYLTMYFSSGGFGSDNGLLIYDKDTGEVVKQQFPDLDISALGLKNSEGTIISTARPRIEGSGSDQWIFDRKTGDIFIAAEGFDYPDNTPGLILHYKVKDGMPQFEDFAFTNIRGASHLAFADKDRSKLLVIGEGSEGVAIDVFDRTRLTLERSELFPPGEVVREYSGISILVSSSDGSKIVVLRGKTFDSGDGNACVYTLEPSASQSIVRGGGFCLEEAFKDDPTSEEPGRGTIFVGDIPADAATKNPAVTHAWIDDQEKLHVLDGFRGVLFRIGQDSQGIYNQLLGVDVFMNSSCGDKTVDKTIYLETCKGEVEGALGKRRTAVPKVNIRTSSTGIIYGAFNDSFFRFLQNSRSED